MPTSQAKLVTLKWDIVLSLLGAGVSMMFLLYIALTGSVPLLH